MVVALESWCKGCIALSIKRLVMDEESMQPDNGLGLLLCVPVLAGWVPSVLLTLLVGWQEGHLACKNWVVRYWHGYLSGARCKWFPYGPADVTAAPLTLAPVKSRMVYLYGAGLARLEKSPLTCSSSSSSSIGWMIRRAFGP